MPKSSKYQPVATKEETQPLHGSREKKSDWLHPELDTIPRPASRVTTPWIWLVHALLLSTSVTFFAVSLCMRDGGSLGNGVMSKISTYSPLFPAVKYELKKYDLAPVTKSPFVGFGPEVDEAWDYIANDIGDIMITEEERVKLGLSPDSLRVQNPKTGEWGYRAGVELFHQLHCLNLLRQALHKDYYENPELGGDIADADSPEDLFGHLDHCIEALRQNLMCHGDVSVFTFREFPELADQGIEGNWPDFEINHMCRNFESLRQWNNEHAAAWDYHA